MLDDTCYFIGFDNFNDAIIAFGLLNSSIVRDLLAAIAFTDAKRVFSKEVLMRLELRAVAELVDFQEFSELLLHAGIDEDIQESDIFSFAKLQQGAQQLQLF